MRPSYITLYEKGELKKRIKALYKMMDPCLLCPRECGVHRMHGEIGYCGASKKVKVASFNLHFGEEPPISGNKGSGTIFFSNCSLKCVYCQNYPISQLGVGKEVTVDELANMMLSLQKRGAHNINLVTATHYIPYVLTALNIAIKRGFLLPIVYNTSGFEKVEILKLLDGIIDIYLPDIKYSDREASKKYSFASNYPEINIKAIKEMFRQVGNLVMDETKIAKRGVLIRHLILPNHQSQTEKSLKEIAKNIGNDIYISLMSQYFPANKAHKFPEINRKIKWSEYKETVDLLNKYGFNNGWLQHKNSK